MTILSVSLSADQFCLRSQYDPDLLRHLKALPGRTWDNNNKTWQVPANAASIKAIEALRRVADVRVPEGLFDQALGIHAGRAAASQAMAHSADFSLKPGLTGELRPYQIAGVEYIDTVAQGKALVGDEMGLGKTITALAALHHRDAFPAVITCPASLTLNWRNEAAKWLPDTKVQVLKDSKMEIDKDAKIVIASYDIAKKRAVDLANLHPKAFIADESHYLKNGKSARTKELAENLAGAPSLHTKLLLSGTPIVNRPKELISQLRMIDKFSDVGGSWQNFVTRYCAGKQTKYGWDIDGSSNRPELSERLRTTCYVRREKKEVLTELPEKQRQYLPVQIEGMAEYKRIMAQADPSEPGSVLGAITEAKAYIGTQKVPAATEYMQSFEETGKKLIVFADHKAVQSALLSAAQETYGQSAVVHVFAEDSAEQRQAAVDRFQKDDKAKVIVCSLKAAGVGLTLTAASDVLMVEQGWTPAEHDQAEDRAHRMGQKNSVNVVYLLAEGTLDNAIHDLIEQKRTVATEVSASIQGELINRVTLKMAEKEVDLEVVKRFSGKVVHVHKNDVYVRHSGHIACVHTAGIPDDQRPIVGHEVVLRAGKSGLQVEDKTQAKSHELAA